MIRIGGRRNRRQAARSSKLRPCLGSTDRSGASRSMPSVRRADSTIARASLPLRPRLARSCRRTLPIALSTLLVLLIIGLLPLSRPEAGRAVHAADLVQATETSSNPPVTPTTAAEIAWPSRAPDMDAGVALFAQRCADCHGPSGRGDGSMVDGLPAPPPDLSDRLRAHDQTAAQLYDIITNGRIERLMPPWREALDVDARWDAVAGSMAWSLTPTRLARGRDAYTTSCASCHGEGGDGVPSAPLGDLEAMAVRSTDEQLRRVRALDAARHPNINELDDATVRLALDHVTSLSFEHAVADGIVADGMLAGRVVPAEDADLRTIDVGAATLQARPYAFVGAIAVPGEAITIPVDATGMFSATNVLAGPNVQWEIAAEIAGVRYPLAHPVSADRGALADPGEAVGSARDDGGDDDETASATALRMPVYAADPTAPIGMLSMTALLSPRPEDGVVEVLERWVLVNRSGLARVARPGSDEPTVGLPLPVGAASARVVDVQAGQDARQEGDVLLDFRPVPPGEHEILVGYVVPYAGNALDLTRVLDARLGEMTVVASDPAVRIESEQLPDRAPTELEGVALERVGGRLLESGLAVTTRLTGLPEAVTSPQTALAPMPDLPMAPRTIALLAMSMAGAAALIALVVTFWSPSGVNNASSSAADRDARARGRILDRLAALDAANRDGRLAPRDYAARRAALLEQALPLIHAAVEASQEPAHDVGANTRNEPTSHE